MLAVLVEISADREHQALHERAHHARGVTVIDRCAEYKHVRFPGAFQRRAQVVANGAHAVGFGIFDLAGETAFAAEELEIIQIHEFRFSPGGFRALHGALQDFGSVPVFAWTAVEKHGKWFAFHRQILSPFTDNQPSGPKRSRPRSLFRG